MKGVPNMVAELVWTWPYWLFAFVVYLSFAVVGGSLIFFIYVFIQEVREGSLW